MKKAIIRAVYVQAMTVIIFLCLVALVVGGAWFLVRMFLGVVE